ncbi:MAG TPA: hypothetical protein PLI09_23600 [Candidatus Hydrogenedentes bacterium]|nr:hypothetical protein [Candidatus Hydrogenedentota bacterium]
MEYVIFSKDREILRRLAEQKLAAAHSPENLERRRLWYAHDAGRGERPMVLTEAWVAFEQLPESRLECREEWAREAEQILRWELFQFHHLQDDHVLEPVFDCKWQVFISNYGVEPQITWADTAGGNVTSRCWKPPIADLDRDFELLKPRTYSVDREGSLASKAVLEEVFSGILTVRMRGAFWWTTGLTQILIDLIGLDTMMMFMCTHPEGIHRLMAFLRDDHLAFIDWLERERLFTLNNLNDCIGSGSMGYSRELPQPDWKEGDPVRTKDLWVLSESQETVSISPAMFEEFVFYYQQPIAERFGRLYYGCCEPLHIKWPVIRKFSNLRRVSVSPWCDQTFMAEVCGRDIAFSRKSNPTLVSTPYFDESSIRADLRETIAIARNCNLELIMKDVHTLAGDPYRLRRWVQLAHEVINEVY